MKRFGTLAMLAAGSLVLDTTVHAATANLPVPPGPKPAVATPAQPGKVPNLPSAAPSPAVRPETAAPATEAPATEAPASGSESPSHPYQGIIERNVFNLKDPKDMPVVETKKEAIPNITLTGITTFLGSKRAFLSIAARPPAQPKDTMLMEGQRDGGVEVISIDVDSQKVKVDNHGTIEVLDFLKNGAKVANTPAPPPVPGVPGAPGVTSPGGNPLRQIPTRPVRGQIPPPPGMQGNSGVQNAPGMVNPQTGQPLPQNKPNLSLEEQTLLIELQREEMRMRNDPAASLLPPTTITPGPEPLPQ